MLMSLKSDRLAKKLQVSVDSESACIPMMRQSKMQQNSSSLLNHNHNTQLKNLAACNSSAAIKHAMDFDHAFLFSSTTRKSGEHEEETKNNCCSTSSSCPQHRNMCKSCGRVVRNQSELERHMLTHSADKPYKCVKCDKCFKNLRNQQSHQFLFHNISDGLSSNRMHGLLLSQNKRKSKSDSNEDEVEDSSDNQYHKLLQKYDFSSLSSNSKGLNLTSNYSHPHSNNDMTSPFPCTTCHKTFATHADLKAHLIRHFTQHPYVCLACGKGFKYDHSLNFHIKSYHGSNNEPDNSNTNFNNNNNNDDNLKDNCMKDVKTIGDNEMIEKTNQNENRKVEKSSASSENSSRNNDERIERDSHSSNDDEDEEEDCSSCGSYSFDEETYGYGNERKCVQALDFGAPANLTQPSLRIKGEKVLVTLLEGVHAVTEQKYTLYKCCLCGFAFPSLEPLTLHLQTSHGDKISKEFTCDKCGAAFKWRSELQLHEQLHKVMDQQGKHCVSTNDGQVFPFPTSFFQSNSSNYNPELSLHSSRNHLSPSHNSINSSNSNNDSNVIIKADNEQNQTDNKIIKSSNKLKTKSKRKAQIDENNKQNNMIQDNEKEQDDLNVSSQLTFQHELQTPVGDIEETAPGQFKCRFCNKTFDRIFSVHRHERVHTGFKPCICKTCGRGFSEKRNLRHHIIRFHSDGSGRELLKRNRREKEKKNNNSCLDGRRNDSDKNSHKTKKSKVKNLITTIEKKNFEGNVTHSNKNDLESYRETNISGELISSIKKEITTAPSIHHNNNSKISSNSRRKGKPVKKIISMEIHSPESSIENGDANDEHNVEPEKDEGMEENVIRDDDDDDDDDRGEEMKIEKTMQEEEDDVQEQDDINPADFLETKFRCHGAFFSSYNPRLGVVEKPVERHEACRPMLGPDGKYLYPCSYCTKTFCSLSDLNRHMNFHEDVRPFKCEYCNYQSRTNSQLKVHMMRHAGIKQYLCQVCNYNGVTQSDLNRHCKTRSHLLRSTNVCPFCALGFSTRTLLDDHINKLHESSASSEQNNNGICLNLSTSKIALTSQTSS